MKIRPKNVNVEKAEQLVRRLKQRQSITVNQVSVDAYQEIIQSLVSCIKLSDGPLQERSAYWKIELGYRIDATIQLLSEISEKEKAATSNHLGDYYEILGLDRDS